MSLQLGHDATDRLDSSADDAEAMSLSQKGLLSRAFGLFFTKKNSLFFFVFLPSVLAGVYYGMIASNQYVAEMRMIVRTIGVSEQFDTSETREGRSMIGGDSLTQDSYIVANYLKSPEIVKKLETEVGLRSYFSREDIDPLSRLSQDASFEELFRYWTRHIDTYVDGPSGIIIFTVRAFSPEESVRIANAALASADTMIDKISEKAKADLVARVEGDVNSSLGDYRVALDDLRNYQNKTGIFDPLSSAKMLSEIIGKLTEQRLQLIVSLKSLEAAGADNTARGRELRRSIQAIDDQIALRQNSMAGASTGQNTQLSSSLTEFSRLETRRIVAQAIYEANVRNLDTAKSAALKRTTFMSIFSNSYVPEESEYPDRFSNWIILTIGLLTLWMTATLIWMSIEDHRV
jgi:capsular polysaccharide transport system permease protein